MYLSHEFGMLNCFTVHTGLQGLLLRQYQTHLVETLNEWSRIIL